MNLLLSETATSSWLVWVILIVVMLVMIVPQYLKRKKETTKLQETLNQLKTGDSIITYSGVFGKIISMRETTVGKVFVIETGDDKHKSYQEIHIDAIMGVDTKRDIILDAEGNDITFADEDNAKEVEIAEPETLAESKTSEELEKEVLEETAKDTEPKKAKKAKKAKK